MLTISCLSDDLGVENVLPSSLDLEQRIEQWARLISRLTAHSVLAVDGIWGVGKTTALLKLKKFLESPPEESGLDPVTVCYLDAWANDDLDEPLLALLGVLNEQFSSITAFDSLASTVREYCSAIARGVLHDVAAAGGLANTIYAVTENSVNANSDQWLEFIKELGRRDHLRQRFRAALDELSDERKLVLMVDELDRCRPDFALRLLERLKHFFGGSNVTVVLGVDLERMAKTVESSYGVGIDGREYLERFVHLELKMAPVLGEYQISEMLGRFGLESYFSASPRHKQYKDAFVAIFNTLASSQGWSFRKTQRCLARIAVVIHQLAENQLFHGPLLSLVVWAENTKIATLQEIEDGAVDITFWIEKLFSSLPQETHYSVARTIGTYISHLRDENQRRRLKQSLDTIINDDSVIEGIRDFAKVSREGAKAPGTAEFNMHWICNLLRP